MSNRSVNNSSESSIFDRGVPSSPSRTQHPLYAQKLWSNALASFFVLHRDGKVFFMKAETDDERSCPILRREYELACTVDHPNIVHVYSFEETLPCVGLSGIMMEWVDGRTLREFLAENPSFKKRLAVMEQILQAVAYLHSRGIVHNDLKPSNILVRRSDDAVRLIDFGLSDDDAHRALRTPGCTMEFAAPELKEQHKSDARSDVYSLGMIMRELLPSSFGPVITKSLHSDPGRRYANASSLLAAFKRQKALPWIIAGSAVFIIIIIALVAMATGQRHLRDMAAGMEASLERQNATLDSLTLTQASLRGTVDDLHQNAVENRLKEEKLKEADQEASIRRNAFFTDIDNQVELLYRNALDSISAARFREFANVIIINYYRAIDNLSNRKQAEAAGQPFASELPQHMVLLMDQHHILQTDVELPSLADAGLSDEEIAFYARLLQAGLPYRPFEN